MRAEPGRGDQVADRYTAELGQYLRTEDGQIRPYPISVPNRSLVPRVDPPLTR